MTVKDSGLGGSVKQQENQAKFNRVLAVLCAQKGKEGCQLNLVPLMVEA